MTESSDHEIERRRAFRLDMEKELIDISWTDEHGKQRNKKVACLDFARGGLRIDSDIEMAVDAPVTVTFKGQQAVKGKVLRCIKQENGWFEVAFLFDAKA